MNKILSIIFYLYILTFSLPGNSIIGFPIKQLLFSILIIIIIIHFFRKIKKKGFSFLSTIFLKNLFKQRNKKYIRNPLAPMFIAIFSLLIWYIYSCLSKSTSSPNQILTNFISLIGTCFIVFYFTKNNLVSIEKAKKWIFITAFLKVGFTILIEIGIMRFGLSYEGFMEIYAQLGSHPVSMPIESLGMYRLMTPSDSFPFIALGFLIADKRYIPLIRILTVLSLVFFSIIVYSRIIFLQLALTLFIALVVRKINFKDITEYKKIMKSIIAIFMIISLLIVIFPKETSNIYESLMYRIFSQETIESDSIRDVQSEILFDNISNNPIIGKGLGYYDPGFIRSDSAKYSYELEYLSFLMQFGILGFILIILMLIYSFYLMIDFKIANINFRYLLYFNFLFWMIKPIFNPNFLSSNSGSLIAVLIILSKYYSRENNIKSVENFDNTD